MNGGVEEEGIGMNDEFFDIDRIFEDLMRFMREFEKRFFEGLREYRPREYEKFERIEGPVVYGFSITIGPMENQ